MRIPLCLVTGFLGSGKTTFLKRIVERRRDEKIVYLVNEFSTADIDGSLVEAEDVRTVSLPGGSIFCKCLVGEFIDQLDALPRRFHADEEPVVGVVVEATGIANPMVVDRLLDETGLREVYDLANIVTIVDPHSFPRLLQTLPNVIAQVRAADWVIINKIDRFEREAIDRMETEVRRLNESARVVRTSYCDVDVPLFEPAPPRELVGDYAKCADPNYAPRQIYLSGTVNVDALTGALRALGDDLYRAKGFLRTPEGMRYLDASTGDIHIEETLVANAPEELAVILRGPAAPRLDDLARRFAAGDFSVP
jgi:G3E family GTPase